MKAIVFSKDRAMQLDLLLTSLSRNAPGLFDVTVLWASRLMQESYAICAAEHPDVTFIEEDGLTYQVRSLVGDKLVAFFTDDDVLYERMSVVPPLREKWICLSLRLGMNTNYCYPLDRAQATPLSTQWEWRRADGDFAYPMSLDGHIFRANDLLPHLGHFTTPNWLEVMLVKAAPRIDRPLMAAYPHSRLVNIPVNRVQDEMPNRNGNYHSVQELNDRYLQGQRIDLDALDFSDIRAAHQEIPLVFR